MNMRDLASLAGGTTRVVGRRHDQCHAANRGDVEFETLAAAQTGRTHHLDLGQLVVPVANSVDGLGTENLPAPEFPDREFRGSRNGPNVSIVAKANSRRGVLR
jgi:hypothetical protein